MLLDPDPHFQYGSRAKTVESGSVTLLSASFVGPVRSVSGTLWVEYGYGNTNGLDKEFFSRFVFREDSAFFS
jgi:hypothetical protein